MKNHFAEVVAAPPYGYSTVCPSLPGGATNVSSPEELVQLLRRVAVECPRPVLATVRRRDGDMLSIGLGRPGSFLTYVPADNFPPYFSVVGVETEGEVCFDYLGKPSFYGVSNTVAFKIALEVVCALTKASGLPLPEMVTWEEV